MPQIKFCWGSNLVISETIQLIPDAFSPNLVLALSMALGEISRPSYVSISFFKQRINKITVACANINDSASLGQIKGINKFH